MTRDPVLLARIAALAGIDEREAARRDVMPPWYGMPEDPRLVAAWAALVAFDPYDKTTLLSDLEAQFADIVEEIRAATEARDAEYQRQLDEPRPSLRALRAATAKAGMS